MFVVFGCFLVCFLVVCSYFIAFSDEDATVTNTTTEIVQRMKTKKHYSPLVSSSFCVFKTVFTIRFSHIHSLKCQVSDKSAFDSQMLYSITIKMRLNLIRGEVAIILDEPNRNVWAF